MVNVESLFLAIASTALAHQEDFGAMLQWTNTAIQGLELDRKTQMQQLMPLIRLAGTLDRSNKALVEVRGLGIEFNLPKNRRRSMQFKTLVNANFKIH